jgi:hypothetical protein
MAGLPIGDYYGLQGLWVESLGQLHTDIYGLSTATAVYVSPAHSMRYPQMGAAHPVWSFLYMERRTVSIEYGFCRTTCEYAGFEGVPIPVIEYSTGVGEEPIQTHPDFESFAGTPSAPLNGAIFIDFETNEKTTDNGRGIFEKFWLNPPNQFSGVTSYLMPVPCKRITSIAPIPELVSRVGRLEGEWLVTGVTASRRGRIYQNVVEFRGPGRRGWNADIYG